MRKLILFMHVSLDGFVAGPEGEMEWISVDSEMFDYAGMLTDGADMALYGRKTYDMMESYWPTAGDQPGATKHDIEHSRWYNSVPKVVVSNTLPSGQAGRHVLSSPRDVGELKQEEGKDILMFGSPSLAHALMQERLIDNYWLFVNPVLLGKGIPVFRNIKDKIKLTLKECKEFSSGVVGFHYEQQ